MKATASTRGLSFTSLENHMGNKLNPATINEDSHNLTINNFRLLYVIANSLPPYGLEASTVLSLVEGAPFRARFPSKWIGQNVRDNLDAIVGSSGIYIFRDFDSGTLTPIRNFIVSRVRIHGDIFLFEYNVGRYIEFDDTPNQRNLQIEQFNNEFIQDHRSIINHEHGGQHLMPLVFFSAFKFEFKRHTTGPGKFYDSDGASWMATVDEIAKNKIFDNHSFFKIAEIVDTAKESSIAINEGTIQIEQNKIYEIILICYTPFTSKAFYGTKNDEAPRGIDYLPKGAVRFRLEVDKAFIFPLLNEATAAGQYDIVKLRFKVLPQRISIITMIGISMLSGHFDDNKQRFAFEIPAFVRANKSLWVASPSILTLFCAIYLFPSAFSTWIEGADSRVIRDFSMIAISVTLFDLINEIRNWLKRNK